MSDVVEVSAIVVSWKARELVRACLRSLYRSAGVKLEAIVVDNASHDGTVEELADEFPAATFVGNDENLGFGRANNVGARLARGRYLLLLNPDATVDETTVSDLVRAAAREPRLGVLGPRMRYPDGRPQITAYRRYPDAVTHTVQYSFALFTMLQILRPGEDLSYFPRHFYERPLEASHVNGAAMLIPRDAFKSVGGFDESFFLYLEETDLCKRLRERGYRVLYTPEATLTHVSGGATGLPGYFAQASPYYLESEYRFMRKHRGLRFARTLHAATTANLAVNAALLTATIAAAERTGLGGAARVEALRDGREFSRRAGRWHARTGAK